MSVYAMCWVLMTQPCFQGLNYTSFDSSLCKEKSAHFRHFKAFMLAKQVNQNTPKSYQSYSKTMRRPFI